LSRAVSLDEIQQALADIQVLKRVDPSEQWAFAGASVVIAYDLGSNGLVAIDIVDHPWPDHMGDPKVQPIIFGAWSLGQFGPFTFPGGLKRATQQSWVWKDGQTVVQQHCSFLRIRSSYVFGADDDAAVRPQNYQPLPELQFLTKVVTRLLDMDAALCYFNPGGEVLRDRDQLRESLNFGWAHRQPPLDIWVNIRLFAVSDDWSMMDTVGNLQLDLPDLEACFSSEDYDFSEVDGFLRNLSFSVFEQSLQIENGDLIEGPGEVNWQATLMNNGLSDPPRPVIRLQPMDGRLMPSELYPPEEPA
jgi:hypothetical protein